VAALGALLAGSAAAKCIPYTEAPQRVGASVCVSGKVLAVVESEKGHWFLNFCEDYRTCPFAVVVFARDLRHVGDVRRLEGQAIEVHGRVQLYEGRPEIILSRARQLRGAAAKLPPVPAEYDADRRGRHRAGTFRTPRRQSSRQGSGRTRPEPGYREIPPEPGGRAREEKDKDEEREERDDPGQRP
jgi:hypothetical protein